MSYHRPTTLDDAVALLAADPARRPLAGGTDLLVGTWRPDDRPAVVDLADLAELRTHHLDVAEVRLGAGVTIADLLALEGLADAMPALTEAARLLGGRQIRAAATIGGNLGNASPAAETAPPLLVHDAEVDLVGPSGSRALPLSELFVGPHRTRLAPGELVVAVRAAPGPSAYRRVELRRSVDIALVSAAVRVEVVDGRIAVARVALGAVAPTPVRAPAAEDVLAGATLDDLAFAVEAAGARAAAAAAPIDDHRARADYRRAMVAVVVRRAVHAAVDRATSTTSGARATRPLR